ncbi:MAG: permease [Rikenellaceae bacterium]|nr:permease [Rikenellaceae bacterium]
MELLNSLLFMLNEMSPYVLLGFLIAGVMHAFVPQRTFARHLSGTGLGAVVKSALVGIPLPLCSCGVLPTAIAMRRNGASRAASTSFLISTPQTGVDSIAATWSLLGPAFAVLRPIAALVTAVLGGVAVGKSETDSAGQLCGRGTVAPAESKSFARKSLDALRYGFIDLVGSIGGWLVTGLIIAALITVYVPADFFSLFGSRPLLSMIAVLIIAIPMYVCATGSIPIALSLVLKGLSPGTAFVLLMAGPAANFASFTLISREMGRKAAVIYLASIVFGAIAFGLAIDYLLPVEWFVPKAAGAMAGHERGFGVFSSVCSAVLVSLLLFTLIKGHVHHKINATTMTKTYVIKGMNCSHCQATVARSIASVKGVEQVDVNLSTGIATVDGLHDADAVVAAVRDAGFDVVR